MKQKTLPKLRSFSYGNQRYRASDFSRQGGFLTSYFATSLELTSSENEKKMNFYIKRKREQAHQAFQDTLNIEEYVKSKSIPKTYLQLKVLLSGKQLRKLKIEKNENPQNLLNNEADLSDSETSDKGAKNGHKNSLEKIQEEKQKNERRKFRISKNPKFSNLRGRPSKSLGHSIKATKEFLSYDNKIRNDGMEIKNSYGSFFQKVYGKRKVKANKLKRYKEY